MLKIFLLLVVILLSCQPRQPLSEQFPVPPEEQEWITYEGRVPLDDKRNLYIEVSMLPIGTTGEGNYKLTETLEDNNSQTVISEFKGDYSTYTIADEVVIVQFYNSAMTEGIKRVFTSNNGKTLSEKYFRKSDLKLKKEGDQKLVVLDNAEPITPDADYNLVKHTSKLFTVEGYFRHNGDSAVFFEINTKEKWAVSKYGVYGQAAHEYHQLVKDKFDAIYLKGIGFSIDHINKDGKKIQALVFKKILQTSLPASP